LPRELLTSQGKMAVPAKKKTTDTADDGDDKQSSPKRGKKRGMIYILSNYYH